MVSSILLQQSINCFIYNYQVPTLPLSLPPFLSMYVSITLTGFILSELKQLGKNLKNGLAPTKPNLMQKCTCSRRIGGIRARAAFDAIETATSPTAFPFFQTDSQQEVTPASKVQQWFLFLIYIWVSPSLCRNKELIFCSTLINLHTFYQTVGARRPWIL